MSNVEVDISWTIIEERCGRLSVQDGDAQLITDQVVAILEGDPHLGEAIRPRVIAVQWTEAGATNPRFGGRTY